ncbi:hypothetical protein NMG60_11008359 [Bertholletia excelsa]
MAKDIGPIICLLIMVLDIAAGVLGIEAGSAENKVTVNVVKRWTFKFECRNPSHEAFQLGLAAAILLALAHIVANLLAGCTWFTVKPRDDPHQTVSANKKLAMISLAIAWMTLAAALSLLVLGTMANSGRRKSCGRFRHRFLSTGGILCFIHALVVVSYYVSAAATVRHHERITKQHGGHP